MKKKKKTDGENAKSMATRGSRRGWMDPLPLEFFVCYSISKRFYLLWKAYKMRDILWVVALLGSVTSPTMVAILDFTKD